jgi:hypothetical protein
MTGCGYVCAGFETLAEILDSFITKSKEFDDNFSREILNNFFLSTCDKFLHSFGSGFGGRKNYSKYGEQEATLFKRCRDYGFLDNCVFVTDSGGFQASIGLLDKRETELLHKIYYEFVEVHKDVYDRAFILDIPPGPGCRIFDSFDDVYKMNEKSYIEASNLPDDVREKIVYIHHFRTPKLWEIYTKILDENNLFDKFKYHATGGIVANMASDTGIPCIIYVLPLIPLINRAKKFNRKKLYFHILGGANYRDILFYELFTIHVQKLHGIDLEITYDSSGIFKGLMIGRLLPFLEDGKVKRLDIRSSSLEMRHKEEKKVIDVYRELLQELCKFGFKDIKIEEAYSSETGTFFERVRIYSMLYMLYTYSDIQSFLKKEAAGCYELYEHKDFEGFNRRASELVSDMNDGKITKKQTSKSNSILKSIEMLTDLDEDFCKYIVNKFLSKDEFTDLTGETLLFTPGLKI